MVSEDDKLSSPSLGHPQANEGDQEKSEALGLPSHVASSSTHDQLVKTARDYAKQAASGNIHKAYSKD